MAIIGITIATTMPPLGKGGWTLLIRAPIPPIKKETISYIEVEFNVCVKIQVIITQIDSCV